MARETTKWPSTRWPITKIMSSDGCNGNRVPLEMGPWYDFREFGCHLGNVGSTACPKTGAMHNLKAILAPVFAALVLVAPLAEAADVETLIRQAEQGYADIQALLGLKYAEGVGVPKDARQAVYWYRKAAEQGNVSAQFLLGSMYYQGRDIPKDDSQAVYWYRKAAEQGTVSAQLLLGSMYYQGRGVPKDDSQAARWYRVAAAQGDVEAMSRPMLKSA